MKRKHSDVEEADPRLKEFLELMQPASKSKTRAMQMMDSSTDEPPTKMQAIEIPQAASDGEYEAVPKKFRKSAPESALSRPITTATRQPPLSLDVSQPAEIIETVAIAPDATDEDWLRSRTSRLLDLVDPADITMGSSTSRTTGRDAIPEAQADSSKSVEPDATKEGTPQEDTQESPNGKADPIIEAIRTNGRLFVRNLPYSASEQDLREHFNPFGSLEEVRVHLLS